MALKVNAIKCPSCGAALPIIKEREKFYCAYCGTPIVITNENEYIYRHINQYVDEEGIRRAEADRLIRLKELEMEEAKIKQSNSRRNMLITVWAVALIVVAIICFIMVICNDDHVIGCVFALNFFIFVGAPIAFGGAVLIYKAIPNKEKNKI